MREFIEEQVSTNTFFRMMSNAIDVRQINKYHQRLTIIFDKFEVGFSISVLTHGNSCPDNMAFLDSISNIYQSFTLSTIGGAKGDVQPSTTKKWREKNCRETQQL